MSSPHENALPVKRFNSWWWWVRLSVWAIYLCRKETCCSSEATPVIYYRSAEWRRWAGWFEDLAFVLDSHIWLNQPKHTFGTNVVGAVSYCCLFPLTGPAERDDIIRISDVIYSLRAFPAFNSDCLLGVARPAVICPDYETLILNSIALHLMPTDCW